MKIPLVKTFLSFFSFLWAAFAAAWFLRNSPYRFLYGVMGVVYSVELLVSAYLLGKKRWAWWLATVVVGVSILISIFDQIGWVDLAYIILATGLLVVLLKTRLQCLTNQ